MGEIRRPNFLLFKWQYILLHSNIVIHIEIINKNKNRKSEKTQKLVYSECLLRLGVLRVLCFSVCLFLCGPFCHGALKLN